jgi:hypothetical protein
LAQAVRLLETDNQGPEVQAALVRILELAAVAAVVS